MKIELVTHCWNPPGLDLYAQMLKHQIASLINYPAECDVVLAVCFNDRDSATATMLFDLISLPQYRELQTFCILPASLSRGELFRRAIGRNMAAEWSTADVVWYVDVDMMFGEGCLDSVVEQVTRRGPGLYQPREVQISYDNVGEFKGHDRPHHEVGHRYVKSSRGMPIPRIDKTQFGGPWTGPCIGGVQIVHGDTAREYGYCKGTTWVEPVDPTSGFRSCRCDVAYRRQLKAVGVPGPTKLDIPQCYRLRHLTDGRDKTLTGEHIGKAAW